MIRGELDIAMHELLVEMIFRVGCDAAQRVQVQIVVQMPVYVIQHRCIRPGSFEAPPSSSSSVAAPVSR
jgi:hypothetical protein